MAKFIAAFGADNVVSIDILPVTNAEYAASCRAGRITMSEQDMLAAAYDPDGEHNNATFERAKTMCDGYTHLQRAVA